MGLKCYVSIFCTAALLILNGCKLDELSDTIIVPEVEDEFYVDLWEDLSAQNRRLILKISTIQEQDCSNYGIDYQFSRDVSRIRVSLEKLVPPETCQTGQAPATTDIDIGPLSAGFFDIDISLRNTVGNEGQLTVNSDRYLLNMNDPAGFILVHDELRRVPNRAIWGYVHYLQPADLILAQQFLTDLSDLASHQQLQDGYYGYFNYKNSGNPALTLREQPPQTATQTFVHSLDPTNRQAVLDLLASYRNEYGSRLELKVFTWEGEVW